MNSMRSKIAVVAGTLIAAATLARSATMKAIVAHEYGGPEVLKYEDAPRPEPKENEVLIRVMAASINPVDVAIREGYLKKLVGDRFPLILGMDAAGVIEKVGTKIDKFKAGDPVIAFFTLASEGGYAQFVVATENEIAHKPNAITFEQAAAVPAAGSTAWKALVETGDLKVGQTVLIHGGSGGVGHFAIQIAKARGAKVIATASSANQDFLKQLGADVAIDYTKEKFEGIAKDVDLVLDTVGEDTLRRSYGVVKKGGMIVSIADRVDPNELASCGIRGKSIRTEPNEKTLEELVKLIDSKKIRPVVSQVLPLSEVGKAHQQIATHHTRGKVVLKIAGA
ncbi:MAG TPA: NADP-dependent oxidoreductase [Chthoniobacterales bacterium]|nr:NADP-dependent oxidoreductase [Chthoniobacterales bacterium]